MRILRLVIGAIAAYQALVYHDKITGALAAFLLFQAITNTGCCATNTCSTPLNKVAKNSTQDIEYEEVK
ncbi:MAG: hypothetical protein R2831_04860 [Chitinophagaceae bacterium]